MLSSIGLKRVTREGITMLSFKSPVVMTMAVFALTLSCGQMPASNEAGPDYAHASQAVTSGPAKLLKVARNSSPPVWDVTPSQFTRLGNLVIFTYGGELELWRSDGTREGTFLIKDIWPGPFSAPITALTEMNGSLFFAANDGVRGLELWKTDGTTAGTVLVKDICPTSCDSNPSQLTNVNGILFFRASDGVNGDELWKSDGTEAGTMLVKDIVPGSVGSKGDSLTNMNGTLFFIVTDPVDGRALWKSDGTAMGTVLLKDIVPGPSSADFGLGSTSGLMEAVGNAVYFAASDGTHGVELWKSDGTEAGTVFVKDINPGSKSSVVSSLTDVGGTLYFAADDGTHGLELWKSDGTEAGTVLVADMNTGTRGSGLASLMNFDGLLIFQASTPGTGTELWRSDGTGAGTTILKEFAPGTESTKFSSFTVMNHSLFFYADTILSDEYWETDGTSGGTHAISSAPNGAGAGAEILGANGLAFFNNVGDVWIFDEQHGRTEPVTDDLHAPRAYGWGGWYGGGDWYGWNGWYGGDGWDGSYNSYGLYGWYGGYGWADGYGSYGSPSGLLDVNGVLFFAMGEDVHGRELWKSDGTEAGTVLVKDLTPGPAGGFPINLANLNGTLVFLAYNHQSQCHQLWRSDGTDAGTYQISWVKVGMTYGDGWRNHACGTAIYRNELYFQGDDGNYGYELWKTDGTMVGTVLAEDIEPGLKSGSPCSMQGMGGLLFFTGRIGENWGLWVTDGYARTAVLVKEFDTHHQPHSILTLQQGVDGSLYVALSAEGRGTEVWKTDGTAAGTVPVTADAPSLWPLTSSNPALRPMVELNGSVYFLGSDGTDRMQLRRWDAAGTTLLKEFATTDVGTTFLSPLFSNLMEINGTLYFTASDSATGAELWTSDGTAAGTALLKDINVGAMSSVPSGQYRVGDAFVFRAADDVHGWELWKSGRTTDSTALVQDIQAGPVPSSPDGFVRSGDNVFFTAMDDDLQYELFVIPVTAIDTPPQIICPDDITVGASSEEGATVAFTATATDIETEVTPTYSQEPGSLFPIGTHTVTATVVDGLGTSVSCSFQITVRPMIVCPESFTVEATSSAGATVLFEVMTTGAISTTYSNDPGSVFALGRTTVTATATNAQGNEASCAFEVNVVDTTPPVIAPLQDIAVESPTPDGVSVAFPAPVVTEAVSLRPVEVTPASGSVFPIGNTVVTVVATDDAGNHSEATFTVTVTLALHKVKSGCGCSSGEAWSGAVLLLGLMARVRRRLH